MAANLPRSVGVALNRIARISSDELGQALAETSHPQAAPTTFSSPQGGTVSGLNEEISSLFPTLRSAGPSARSSVPRGRALDHRRYANSEGRGRKRRGRSAPASSEAKRKSKPVSMDLVVIPDPEESSVPTHAARLELEAQGMIIHEFPFDREWDDTTLRRNIEKEFPVLQSRSFEFVKASYGELIVPKLAKGVKVTGDLAIRMAGQGAVYIRSVCDNLLNPSNEELDLVVLSTPTFTVTQTPLSPRAVDQGTRAAVDQPEQESRSSNLLLGDTTSFPANLETPYPSEYDLGSELMEKELVKIHRSTVKKDMIETFIAKSILYKKVDVKIIDSRGNEEIGEGEGVVRDAFSLFWTDAYNSLMLGEDERVPSIRHDMDRVKWEAVARVLVKGYTQERYFPIQISQAFLCACLFGEDSITDEGYLESFQKYVSRSEADVIDKVFSKSIAVDDEDLLDFLSVFDCKKKVTEENLCGIVIELAHKELVQKPKYVADCWVAILSTLKTCIPNKESLSQLYASLHPTPSKVSRLIQANPTTPEEAEVVNYLKRWIKGLDEASLKKFLRFCTGSDVLLCDGIHVSFTTLVGINRRPIFHTCGYVLELPSAYEDYCDFREEFSAIISQGDLEMAIA